METTTEQIGIIINCNPINHSTKNALEAIRDVKKIAEEFEKMGFSFKQEYSIPLNDLLRDRNKGYVQFKFRDTER